MNRIEFSKKIAFVLFAIILAVILALPALFSNLADDAYIHSRIVNNFLQEGLPYFNLEQRFKASSSTGYILTLAALAGQVGVVGAIRFVCFGSTLFFVIGMVFLLRKKELNEFNKVLIFLGATSPVLWAAYSGMETALVCALLVYSALAYKKGRSYTAVFLISIAAVYRFEVNALLLISVSLLFLKDRSAKVLLCLVPSVTLMLCEQYFFGQFIPNAAKAKAIGYNFPLSQSILNNFSIGSGIFGRVSASLLVLIALIQIWRSRSDIFQKNPLPVAFFTFSAIMLVVWSISKSMVFPWYFCLAAVPFCLAASLNGNGGNSQSKYGWLMSTRFLTCFVTSAFFLLGAKGVTHQLLFMQANGETDRVSHYLKIGAGLELECPNCTLLTSEIGGLGYTFKGTVYDAFGLGDPEAIKFHPLKVPEERSGYGVGAIPPKYVEMRDPDFVVSMPIFSEAFRMNQGLKYYVYDCLFDGKPVFGDDRIQIFSKYEISAHTLAEIQCKSRKIN